MGRNNVQDFSGFRMECNQIIMYQNYVSKDYSQTLVWASTVEAYILSSRFLQTETVTEFCL